MKRRVRRSRYYRLCWGHDPANLSDFKFELDGLAELVGPFLGDLECTLGLPCVLHINGYGLAPTNKIVAISSGMCGHASPRNPGSVDTIEGSRSSASGKTVCLTRPLAY